LEPQDRFLSAIPEAIAVRAQGVALVQQIDRPFTRGRDSKPVVAALAESVSKDVATLGAGDAETRSDATAMNADLDGVVDATLARALDAAAKAGRFDVVAQLARELEARRLARAGRGVVDLAAERDGRGAR